MSRPFYAKPGDAKGFARWGGRWAVAMQDRVAEQQVGGVRTKRSHDAALSAVAPAEVDPHQATPSETNPLRWGPPPLEPIPVADARDAIFNNSAPSDSAAEGTAAKPRSSLSLKPRCLAVARPNRDTAT